MLPCRPCGWVRGWVGVRARARAREHTHSTRARARTYTYTNARGHTHIHTSKHVRAHTHTQEGGHKYKHSHTHARAHTHTDFLPITLSYACVCLLVEGENLLHLLGGLPPFAGGPGGDGAWGRSSFMCLAAAVFLPTVSQISPPSTSLCPTRNSRSPVLRRLFLGFRCLRCDRRLRGGLIVILACWPGVCGGTWSHCFSRALMGRARVGSDPFQLATRNAFPLLLKHCKMPLLQLQIIGHHGP